jgi:hypothetical protein
LQNAQENITIYESNIAILEDNYNNLAQYSSIQTTQIDNFYAWGNAVTQEITDQFNKNESYQQQISVLRILEITLNAQISDLQNEKAVLQEQPGIFDQSGIADRIEQIDIALSELATQLQNTSDSIDALQ